MLRIPVFCIQEIGIKFTNGEVAEWLTNSPGANWNIERSDDGPQGEGRESPSNALPGERPGKTRDRTQYLQFNGEVAEWLKALPC